MRSLYGLRDMSIGTPWSFSIKPFNEQRWPDYMRLKKRVSLKRDFRWGETDELRAVLRKADLWEDFPVQGVTLVNAEFKAGDEEQRIDLLYLRDDGALLPCEMKLGGTSRDTHGQLLRYIADLYNQKLDVAWVQTQHAALMHHIDNDIMRDLHTRKFAEFLARNPIEDRFIRVLPRTGILMDEGFPPQLLKAVRYLNGYAGFSIRLLEMQANVETDWAGITDNFLFRVDFVDVQ